MIDTWSRGWEMALEDGLVLCNVYLLHLEVLVRVIMPQLIVLGSGMGNLRRVSEAFGGQSCIL